MVISRMDNRIGALAVKALLYEVAATPKPGLVDRVDTGAHDDMDYYTFMDSASVLGPYFTACASYGLGDHRDDEMLTLLKPKGMLAETEMFRSTNGINTHKGLIYALGLVSCAAAAVLKDGYREDWMDQVGEKVHRYVKEKNELGIEELKESETYGGRQYRKYGLLGARGEALSGYYHARVVGYGALNEAITESRLTINDAMLVALLKIITSLSDSNVIGRHNQETLNQSQKMAMEVIESGHLTTDTGRERYDAYIKWSKSNRVSHGGAADLLAVSVFFYFIDQDKNDF